MATFSFPYHTFETEYPESSFRVTLGGSYQYSAPPPAPDQRIFRLKFAAMKYFVASNGTIDKTTHPEFNVALLDDFYNTHKTHASFTYPHPVYGNLSCRFNKPLRIPAGIPQGGGAVPGIEVELIETPGISV